MEREIDKVRDLPSVCIKTFGCQMNEYDSQKMFALLQKSYRRVEEADSADLVIVNTCSVREKAEHKLYSLLGVLRDLKKEKKDMLIGVSGCVAQQEGKEILKRDFDVDFVVGTHNLSLVPSLVEAVRQGKGPQVAVDYRDEWEEIPEDFDAYLPAHDRSLANDAFGAFGASVRALVAIQRGCNKNCSFCVVPTTRGPEVSRPVEEIEREIKLKARLGVKEVMLLGQTVNSYGRDLLPQTNFEDLVRRIAAIDGIERIRFTSPHPQEVRSSFIKLYSEVKELCPFIHLPLQSGSDRILKLMNRNYRRKRYMEIVKELKAECPEIAISTDIIVGFPTETEADFLETLEVMDEVCYHSSFSFIYSQRPHTAALKMFSEADFVSRDIASARLSRLQILQKEISQKMNRKLIGKVLSVLIENVSSKDNIARGRIPENTLVEVTSGIAKVGQIIPVEIRHAGPISLRGEFYNGQ